MYVRCVRLAVNAVLCKQEKGETWDSFISKLKAEGEHCDFPAGWLDTEILMAMIESGKSKRVRRKLLQDQLTLAEALKYARGLESADQHATKVENETPTDVTVKQEVDKITVEHEGEVSVSQRSAEVHTDLSPRSLW